MHTSKNVRQVLNHMKLHLSINKNRPNATNVLKNQFIVKCFM